MARIGVLGGTFDPPHMGHLWLAESARQTLSLDLILFIPVGEPPHKEGQTITEVRHRLAMTECAIESNAHLALDETDVGRPPPHFTATLLALLNTRYPASDLWLLIGSDSLDELPTWHRPDLVVQRCRLACLPRPGVTVDWIRLSNRIPGIDSAVDMLDGPTIQLSATQIRRWVAAGRSARYLVPEKVLDYIETNRLYLSLGSRT